MHRTSKTIRTTRSKPRIVIIGAGLQGISAVLALSQHHIDSVLLEQKPMPMRGASYGNEGKIHLGLVYALDSSMQTGIEMLRGALAFSPLLDLWCGAMPWHEWKSAGFRYAVMPGSLSKREELEDYYENLRLRIAEAASSHYYKPSYFGAIPTWLWRPAEDPRGTPQADGIPVASYDTEEVAIDTRMFSAALIERTLKKPGISLRCNTSVVSVERRNGSFMLTIETPHGREIMHADAVVNCSWADRFRLDRMVGAANEASTLCYRVKHRIIVKPRNGTSDLLPVTMVQGPYGDVVPLWNGSVYLSWYPECRTYFGEKPPAVELHDRSVLDAIATRSLECMSSMFPSLEGASIASCSPCTIVAEGSHDVDNPDSELHRRTNTGPQGGNGWWSVNTGKLTLAPLHGETTARLIVEELGLG